MATELDLIKILDSAGIEVGEFSGKAISYFTTDAADSTVNLNKGLNVIMARRTTSVTHYVKVHRESPKMGFYSIGNTNGRPGNILNPGSQTLNCSGFFNLNASDDMSFLIQSGSNYYGGVSSSFIAHSKKETTFYYKEVA